MLAERLRTSSCARRRRRRRRASAFAPLIDAAASGTAVAGAARRPRSRTSPVVLTGMLALRRRGGRPRRGPCACRDRRWASGARSRRRTSCRSRGRGSITGVPGRDHLEVDLRDVERHAHGAAVDDRRRSPSRGARTRPGRWCASRSRRRTARAGCSRSTSRLVAASFARCDASCACFGVALRLLLLGLVGRDEAAVEQRRARAPTRRRSPAGARRWRAPRRRRPGSTRSRCGSRASPGPRRAARPRRGARAPCRRRPRRTAGRRSPRPRAAACRRTCASRGTSSRRAATTVTGLGDDASATLSTRDSARTTSSAADREDHERRRPR